MCIKGHFHGKIELLQHYIDTCSRIVFFGGAGVSTESGIPDFRSQDGLYHMQYDDPPETILSHTYFEKYPEKFFRFYRSKTLFPDAMLNAAHYFLTELEKNGKLSAVITQNIDGLHKKSRNTKCSGASRQYFTQLLRKMPQIPFYRCHPSFGRCSAL